MDRVQRGIYGGSKTIGNWETNNKLRRNDNEENEKHILLCKSDIQ
jgi:hypothetical protein